MLSVIILSAGKGTRMKSSLSKPLHKIGNLEMINHIMKTIENISGDEVILVVSRENKTEMEENIKNTNLKNVKTAIQYERKGTGDAVKIGFKNVDKKSNLVLITMGDVPLIEENTYNDMINRMEDDCSIIVMGFRTRDTKNRYGRLILNKNQELEKIVEYKDATEEERNNNLCNAGIYLVRSEILEELLDKIDNKNASGEYYITSIIEIAKRQGLKINYSMAEEDEVMGINSQEELAKVESIFQDKKRKYFMQNGVNLIDPKSVYFSYDTEIGNGTTVEPNVIFQSGVKVHSNVVIKAFSYLENCEIKSNAVIGPFARIRPESIVGENARIGNFCEIKKSNIGKNTKINHLTYIGDAQIGENTNIGAGTITCNYDGYKKFKTEIGKNSFIGSNTTFIAPVEVGDNVLVGAGSVIDRKIEDNEMAITRAEQKNIEDGMIKYREKRENK